ncbi:4-hydroxybenzoate octaprenyltransferase [Aspergillus mulundensis]|uniref:Uncharacterized protein n=1 Tax=Aspergillus mulundensis TaxID=1810919 RepID=A0A3D8RXZ4_9EURO|nr:hypothetical protein DSM5745_05789 [Aspergillus mulundensis]RDW78937.1 hypothetical protein DSM5745_05789 [Aspergillus mulundensis]
MSAPNKPTRASPPPSQQPLQGLVSYLPSPLLPYAQLIRLDKPIGFAIVYLPYLIGIVYAASVAPTPLPMSLLLNRARIFLTGSIILRSAGCTWDDIVDQDLDRQVQRSRSRPIPRGAVTTRNACLFALAIACAGVANLRHLPRECTHDAIFIVTLSLIYPYLKRVTHYPQLVLGLTIGFAVIMAAHSLAVDPWAYPTNIATGSLYFAVVLLMMLYDIIYARQDTTDDIKAGVKSMAVRFRHSIRLLAGLLALVITVLLAATGISSSFGRVYFGTAVGGTGVSLGTVVLRMNLENPDSYHCYVGAAYMVTSVCILGGLLGEYAIKAGLLP